MKNVIVRYLLIPLIMSVLAVPVWADIEVDPVVDSLFVIASSGEVMHQEACEPAMDSIATYGVKVVPFLIEKLNVISRQEKWTALWVLERIGSPSVPQLIAALGKSDGKHVQQVCWALSRVGDSTAVERLIDVLGHSRWQVREEALGALSSIGDVRSQEAVANALSDSIGQVRKAAAVASGNLKPPGVENRLIDFLDDDFYGARMSAVEALIKLDTTVVVDALSARLPKLSIRATKLSCQVLSQLATDGAIYLLRGISRSGDPSIRAIAGVGIIQADPSDRCGYQKALFEKESDRLVLLKLNSALRSTPHDE